MADPQLMDRMFTRIMRGLVDTGPPPHYAELSHDLGVSVPDSRQLLNDVMSAYPIGWLHPETDYIASFPPLNGLPTQYRVRVRGEQKWFAQCGFESTSVSLHASTISATLSPKSRRISSRVGAPPWSSMAS